MKLEALKFVGNKLSFQLEAQSPMIHFQLEQSGATLRASEMKPKLDRYLWMQMLRDQQLYKELGLENGFREDEFYGKLEKNAKFKSAFVSPKHFNYKVQITESGDTHETKEVELKDKFKIYYGWQKKAIFSDPQVTIICFNPYLRELIEKHIFNFFLATNFGTMQGKGFGSFVPKVFTGDVENLTEEQEYAVAEALKESYQLFSGPKNRGNVPFKCYQIRFSNSEENFDDWRQGINVNIFENIRIFYGIMKSGGSMYGGEEPYIYEYFLEKYQNEKEWMRNPYKYIDFKKTRFLKVLLGLSSPIRFRNGEKVMIKNKNFSRVSSPIYFKVVKNVLFISAKEIPEEIYGSTFKFEASKKNIILSTPMKGEFDIQAFLSDYVEKYNRYIEDTANPALIGKKVMKVGGI